MRCLFECHAAHDKDCIKDRDRKIVNGMPPNLLAHYLYLWELTAVRQVLETAWISASVRRTFTELLVPAGSSSSLGQALLCEIRVEIFAADPCNIFGIRRYGGR